MIIDLYTLVGPAPSHGGESGLDPLRTLLQRRDVAAAAVVSTVAIYLDAAAGNRHARTLCERSAGENSGAPHFIPGAVLDPRGDTNLDDVAAARIVYALPATQNWPIRYAPFRDALRRLADSAPTPPVVVLEMGSAGDATDAAETVERSGFAGAVVLSGIGGRVMLQEAIAVARNSAGMYLATNRLRGIGEVARAATALGAERLLFCSGIPAGSLGAALRLLQTAEISDADRAMILGANAQKLLPLNTGTGAAS